MSCHRIVILASLALVIAAAAAAQTGQPFVPAQTWYTDAAGDGAEIDAQGDIWVEVDGIPGMTGGDHSHPVPAEVQQGIDGAPDYRLSPTRRHLYAYGSASGNTQGVRMYLYAVPETDGASLDFIAGEMTFTDGIAFERFFDLGVPDLASYFFAVSDSDGGPAQRIWWVNLASGATGLTNDLSPSVQPDVTFAPNGIAAFLRHDGTFPNQSSYYFIELCDDDLGMRVNQGGAPYDDLDGPDVATAFLAGDVVNGFLGEVLHDGSVIGVSPLDACGGATDPVGACCVDGACIDGVTEGDCADLGGEWQGAGTDCQGIDCPDVPAAQLTLTGTGPATTTPLTPTTFSFTCANIGDAEAQNTAITVYLPSNDVTFVSAGQGGLHLPSQGRVVWQMGTLPAGDQVTVTLTLEAGCDANRIYIGNYSAVASDTPVAIGSPAVISELELPSTTPLVAGTSATVPLGEPVDTGETITYTLALTNDGAEDRGGLNVAVNYGPHVAFDGVVNDGGGIVTDEGFRFLWEGDLAAGQSAQVTVRVAVVQCRQGENLQTQLNGGLTIGLFNSCGQFIQGIAAPGPVTVAPSDAVTSVTVTSTPAPRVVDAAWFPVPTLVRPDEAVEVEWRLVNRGAAPLALADTRCQLGALVPDGDPPFLQPPPAGTAWDAAQNQITFDGTVAAGDTVRVRFGAIVPADADCQLTMSATVATGDCATLAQAFRRLITVPEPIASPHLLASTDWGEIGRGQPDSSSTVDPWLCFTGEIFWDPSANHDGSFWLAGLPSYRVDPASLALTVLDQGFTTDIGLANITGVVEDSTSGVVYLAGNTFDQGQALLGLRAWDPDTDQRTVVYDEVRDVDPRLGTPHALVLDDQGHLAVGTGFGVFRIDPADTTDAVLHSDPLLPSGALNLALLPDGRYAVADNVFGTTPEPLVAIDPTDGTHTVLVPDLNQPAGAPTIPYLAAAADDSNRVFLATQQGAVTMVDLRTSPATLTPLFSSLQGLGGLTWMGGGEGGEATPVSDLPHVPNDLVLGGATPNPFNPRTTVRFELPRPGRVTLELFDVRGRLVTTLVDADLAAGRHEVVWRGADAEGRAVASGAYLARLRAGGEARTAKLLLAR